MTEDGYIESVLHRLRYSVADQIGPDVAARMKLSVTRDVSTERLVRKLHTAVLSEELPAHVRGHVIEWSDPRHATWVDHFTATYRGRWWGRLIGLHRRTIRYVDVPLRHRVDVTVRQYWTYPRATRVLPGDDFGHVVLKTRTETVDRYYP